MRLLILSASVALGLGLAMASANATPVSAINQAVSGQSDVIQVQMPPPPPPPGMGPPPPGFRPPPPPPPGCRTVRVCRINAYGHRVCRYKRVCRRP